MLGSILRRLFPEKTARRPDGLIVVASVTPAARWAAALPGSAVLRAAVEGRYGEPPTWLYVGADETGEPLAPALEGLARKIDGRRVEGVVLALTDEEMSPEIELRLPEDRQADRVVTVEIPYWTADADSAFAERIRAVVAALATDAHSAYAYAHDASDVYRREDERRRRPLLPGGSARGPYWYTYYDGEIVRRLGGFGALAALPAHRVDPLGDGVLVQSHPTPEAFDREPKRTDLRTLDAALTALATG